MIQYRSRHRNEKKKTEEQNSSDLGLRKKDRPMMNPFRLFPNSFAFILAAIASSAHLASSTLHPSTNLSTESNPASLLAKSIVGGSTQIKTPPEETSSLFGVGRVKLASENESIHVVKRDGSKEPLEAKKVRQSL